MLRYTHIVPLLLLVIFKRDMSNYYLYNVYLLLNFTT